MKVYLAGSVPKWDVESKTFYDWRKVYGEKVLDIFPQATFIDPFDRNIDESDFFLVFWIDCKHIKESDIVIVNAENKLWAGTSQELLIAKYFHKPVITILPKNTKHRKTDLEFKWKIISDWIHPFIYSTSDFIIESIEEISEIKEEIFTKEVKNITIIDKAILQIK